MKKIYVICTALFLLPLLWGCSDTPQTDEQANPVFVQANPVFEQAFLRIFIRDAQEEIDLLDPNEKFTIADCSIKAVYDGMTYDLIREKPFAGAPLGLYLVSDGPEGMPQGYHLLFGGFDPARNYRNQRVVIDVLNEKIEVDFDLYVDRQQDAPTVATVVRLDGTEVGAGPEAWVIERKMEYTSQFIWDLLNPAVTIGVRDAATGEDLLDPASENSILGRPIAVTYNGLRYEVSDEEDYVPAARGTRATLARLLKLRHESWRSDDGSEAYYLTFGDFNPYEDYRDQSFTVDWGDGTFTQVEFSLYLEWDKGMPMIHQPIRVDGLERDSWMIDIEK